jgi:hypothetical protein
MEFPQIVAFEVGATIRRVEGRWMFRAVWRVE